MKKVYVKPAVKKITITNFFKSNEKEKVSCSVTSINST